MKTYLNRVAIVLVVLSLSAYSCKKKEENSVIDETVDTNLPKLKQGTLSDGDPSHKSSGQVQVFQSVNNRTLQFNNFLGSTKPDVRVYLSTQSGNIGNAIELGAVKATQGNFNYTFDNQVDLSTYKFVVLWCKQFGVLFGKAELTNP